MIKKLQNFSKRKQMKYEISFHVENKENFQMSVLSFFKLVDGGSIQEIKCFDPLWYIEETV